MSSETRTSVPNSLNEHWMPFTSNKDFKANPRLITEAQPERKTAAIGIATTL
jgi:beta-alanine--pyruvate transaminase